MSPITCHSLLKRVPLFTGFFAWLVFVSIFNASPMLRALDPPTSFTINLPFQVNEATPAWLGHPVTPQTTFATLDLPIVPPDAKAALLVTVFFQEKDGGFLRLTWKGTQGAQVLSDNFYEGIAMSNQRSLLITAQTLQGQGTLSFQCGDTTLGIQRIKLEWLQNQDGLVSPQVQDALVTPATGFTQTAQNLSGQPKQPSDPSWHDHFVNVPITDQPQRIEKGVEFSVQLDNVPGAGRLALKEAGLPMGKHLVVWINQQRAGTITPAVPELTDDGFLDDASSPLVYVGWREGSFYVPATFFKTGANAVQLAVEDDAPAKDSATPDSSTPPVFPLAVKDVVLQLNYPPLPDASTATQSTTGATSSDVPSSNDSSSSPTTSSTPTGSTSP